MNHISVLQNEVLEGLSLKKGEIFVDATLGSAGHSLSVCQSLGSEILVIGIDQDKERIEESQKKLEGSGCKFKLFNDNFRNLDKILKNQKVDKILFDLGLNSKQLESSGRGFSFLKEEPLLMNFGTNNTLTAKEILNEWAEESIADVIWGYGGERFARKIARKIVEERKGAEIKTTTDLVEIIERAVPAWYKKRKIHPATKTFQALRIAVNEELDSLKEGLEKGFEKLNSGGRIAVISFHELEDRLVKRFFKELKERGQGQILTKKPTVPSRDEIMSNPRSRSAKLRIIEKKDEKPNI